jgi:hypothetical protein
LVRNPIKAGFLDTGSIPLLLHLPAKKKRRG